MRHIFPIIALTALAANPAKATSYAFTTQDSFNGSEIVAEAKVIKTSPQYNAELRLDELVCECVIIRDFKSPASVKKSKKFTITFHILDKTKSYKDKTFVIFAFNHERGLRPLGGQFSLIEKPGKPNDDKINANTPYDNKTYTELLKKLSILAKNEG